MFHKIVEKSAVKTGIQLEKDHKLVCRKISNLYKVSSFNVCLSFTKQVNYKVSSIAKNYALLLSPNNPTEAEKSVTLAITRRILHGGAKI